MGMKLSGVYPEGENVGNVLFDPETGKMKAATAADLRGIEHKFSHTGCADLQKLKDTCVLVTVNDTAESWLGTVKENEGKYTLDQMEKLIH